ncbi:MAG TPA: DUF456 domain-containing protein [Flavobacteriaceae bacterium]|nr:DUF456 domain-containing protein [Flavobacteriaceae bacterium]
MDILLLIVGFLFLVVGLFGAILPILPGPPLSWIGLLLINLTSIVPINYTLLGITLFIAILVTILDYVIPAWGTKKFGGSKYGVIGTSLGLFIGLIIPIPFGIIIGAFLGAFIGELYNEKRNTQKALKASFGSVVGFFISTGLKLLVSIVYLVMFIKIFWENRTSFIGF